MAKSRYTFEKRQKELARKQKKEEKRQRKLQKNTPDGDVAPDDGRPEADAPENDETAA